LRAFLRHHLAAPAQFDLGGLPPGQAGQLQNLSAAQSLVLRSLGELLHHPSPPLPLLVFAKDFAKANMNHPESQLPPPVARLLYYASIAAALARRHERISRMPEAALRQGFAWAAGQTWIDELTRALFVAALGCLPGPNA
jgi:hypothetical protein